MSPPRDDGEPRRIIKRRTPNKPLEWVKVDHYPLLEGERIRGVDVFRTKHPAPVEYRIVISAFIEGAYRIPAVVAIPNERRIRFGSSPVDFYVLAPGERKAEPVNLPLYRDRDVILSNPDFVEYHP